MVAVKEAALRLKCLGHGESTRSVRLIAIVDCWLKVRG